MEQEKFKELVKKHNDIKICPDSPVARTVITDIEKGMEDKSIISISGVRQSGKTALLGIISKMLKEKGVSSRNILYLDCKDERLAEFDIKRLCLFIEKHMELMPKGKFYILLDEIEAIKDFSILLHSLTSRYDVKIFITRPYKYIRSGSDLIDNKFNKRLINLHTLSFKEYVSFKTNKKINDYRELFYEEDVRIELRCLFNTYLKFGGFPKVCLEKDKASLRQNYIEIMYKDIISRHMIKNIYEIRLLCLYIFSNIPFIVSYRNLMKVISAKSTNSIKNYLEYLEEVFLIHRINLFSNSIKKRVFNSSKIYSADLSLSDFLSYSYLLTLDKIYENMVFLELTRRGEKAFYYRTEKGGYVDFLLRKGIKITELIQVVHELDARSLMNFKVNTAVDVCISLKLKEFTVITASYLDKKKIEGVWVKCVPLAMWLLQ